MGVGEVRDESWVYFGQENLKCRVRPSTCVLDVSQSRPVLSVESTHRGLLSIPRRPPLSSSVVEGVGTSPRSLRSCPVPRPWREVPSGVGPVMDEPGPVSHPYREVVEELSLPEVQILRPLDVFLRV